MLSFSDIQNMIAGNFFDGNTDLAGFVMFGAAILLILAITKGNTFYALIAGMVAAMFFTAVGILSTELSILLIIVSVLGLAYTSRSVWND